MKKFLACAALFAAMFLTVSCGGSDSGNDNNEEGGNGTAEQLCHYGEYKCDGGNSYFCGYMDGSNDLTWKFSEQCANGCDSVTGKCSEGSNSNDNGNGNDNSGNDNNSSEYPAADNSYNANYGFISLNFSFDGIGNADDSDFDSDTYEYGIEQGEAYATGTYGNGSAAINPENAVTYTKQADYYSSNNLIWVGQVPVIQNGSDYVGSNPVIEMYIDANQASVGKMEVSPFEGSHVQLFVEEHNWSTHQAKCIHAFAEGQINISKLGDLVYHGALELTGALQLYSPKNYKGQDVSEAVKSSLGLDTCPVVY